MEGLGTSWAEEVISEVVVTLAEVCICMQDKSQRRSCANPLMIMYSIQIFPRAMCHIHTDKTQQYTRMLSFTLPSVQCWNAIKQILCILVKTSHSSWAGPLMLAQTL